MPLLNKEPFIPNEIPEVKSKDVNKEIYFNLSTQEATTSYEEYFSRHIVANSLDWSCPITGKANLTFKEAVNCELKAKYILEDFPNPLKFPILYLVTLTTQNKLSELCDEILDYVKDRTFIGETVKVATVDRTDGVVVQHMRNCVIIGIKPIIDAELAHIISSPALFEYSVLTKDDIQPATVYTVNNTKIKRDKGVLTREKLRLFLKYYTCKGEGQQRLFVNEELVEKYRLKSVSWTVFFPGPVPQFAKKAVKEPVSKNVNKTANKKIVDSKNKQKSNDTSHKKTLNSPTSKKSKSSSVAPKEKLSKAKDDKVKVGKSSPPSKTKEIQRMAEKELVKPQEPSAEEIKKRREEERERKKEGRKLLAEVVKEWHKPRDDLECDDLLELPSLVPIKCNIPANIFGDFLKVLEFLSVFGKVVEINDTFPQGVTFDILERALTEKELAGPFNDVIQLLLHTIFSFQEEEAEEIKQTSKTIKDVVELDMDALADDMSLSDSIKSATVAATWSHAHQGLPIYKLTLNALTVTEVLRLHLMSSGGRCNEANSHWRYQQRGGYRNEDDPGLEFRIKETRILRELTTGNVFDLTADCKLKVICCLMEQIVTFASVRDLIEEELDTVRVIRNELRMAQQVQQKKEREDANERSKIANGIRPGAEIIVEEPVKEDKNPTDEPLQPPVVEKISPKEADDFLAKIERESSKRKAEFVKKESSLLKSLNSSLSNVYISPLGKDRAYRRYWIFNSISGLFVEDDDEYLGNCIPLGTPAFNPESNPENNEHAKKIIQQHIDKKFSNGKSLKGNDKENIFKELIITKDSSSKKLLAVKNNSINSQVTISESVSIEKKEAAYAISAICSGNQTSCPVHSRTITRQKWCFIQDKEAFENLLQTLSSRGIREKELKKVLESEKQKIIENISQCPAHKLNSQIVPTNILEQRKSIRTVGAKRNFDSMLNFPPGTCVDMILDYTFRDTLLELEEKIYCGGLGVIKAEDRDSWRQAVEIRCYDPQCKGLVWGNGTKQITFSNPYSRELLVKQFQDLGTYITGNTGDTPISMDSDEKSSMADVPVVIELACAALQIAQCLEEKFIQEPLGVSDKDKKKMAMRKSEGNDEDTEEKKPGKITLTTLQRWELSLMACSSISQLFIHLSTFDDSVQWTKSLMNAYCRLCRRKTDGENMLLCDGCNNGFHMYCLKPKLNHVPKGDWFCATCKPKEKDPPTPRKSRRIFSEEEEEEESEEEEEEEESEEEEENDDERVERSEICAGCRKEGHLVLCDTCPFAYHLKCMVPKLRRVPTGKWSCQKCKEKQEEDEPVVPKQRRLFALGHSSAESLPEETIGKKRKCTKDTVAKIAKATKQLTRKDSYDGGEDSEASSLNQSPWNSRLARRNLLRKRSALSEDIGDLNLILLEDLIEALIHHEDSWPFLSPVTKAEAEDYHTVITNPMDLGKIKNKVFNVAYKHNSEFMSDVKLVFDNCYVYNKKQTMEFKAGSNLRKFFRSRCQELDLKIDTVDLEQPATKKNRSTF